MSPPGPLDSASSPSPKGIYTDDVQISSACKQLRVVLGHLSAHIQDNLYLRDVNAKLNGETVSSTSDYKDTNSGEAAVREAKKLLLEINDVTNDDGDEKGLKKNELLEKLKKSFEEMDSLAAKLIAKNEDLRESNDYLDSNGVQQFEQAQEQLKKRKEEGEEGYQEDRYDDDTSFPPKEESEETYKDLCSLQVRASDKLFCLLDNLDGQIQENQKLREVNAKLKGDPSPPPPYDKYKEAEAAAEEAKQLLLESKSRVSRNDEQQDLNKLVQKLKKKSKEISSLTADVIRESEDLKVTNGLLEIYGLQKFERQSDIKEVVTAPESAPRDQDRNDDDLREKNRFLQAKLQAMEAAMTDAGKTTRATITPVLLDTLSPAQLFIRRANLPSDSQHVKQQVKSIDSFKPPKHPSSAPSSSPPNDPPPSSATGPLDFLRSASEWLRWLIWFFVFFMVLVGVFLCWIEWAELNRERSMWLGANEISRMEVEGEIAKAWRSWDRVGIVFCFDRGLSLRLLKLILSRRGGEGIIFVS